MDLIFINNLAIGYPDSYSTQKELLSSINKNNIFVLSKLIYRSINDEVLTNIYEILSMFGDSKIYIIDDSPLMKFISHMANIYIISDNIHIKHNNFSLILSNKKISSDKVDFCIYPDKLPNIIQYNFKESDNVGYLKFTDKFKLVKNTISPKYIISATICEIDPKNYYKFEIPKSLYSSDIEQLGYNNNITIRIIDDTIIHKDHTKEVNIENIIKEVIDTSDIKHKTEVKKLIDETIGYYKNE